MSNKASHRPVYAHGCDACTFLAHYNDDDLYHCTQGSTSRMPTVIARHSGKPADYTSGIYVAKASNLKAARELGDRPVESLRVAYLIAKDMGLCD